MNKFKKNWLPITITFVAILILILIVSVILYCSSITRSSIAAIDSYDESKLQAQTDTYKEFYSKGYDYGEEKNHVSNDVSIIIGDIKEKSELEVLKIQDIVFVVSEEDKKTVWFKAKAVGVFTVNLSAGEIVVDSDRHYVLVRVPLPELNDDTIDITDTEKLMFEDGKFNTSISEGVKLAQDLLKEARSEAIKDFTSNQDYNNSAERSAETLIKSMIKSLNYNVDDLVVEVEFYQ